MTFDKYAKIWQATRSLVHRLKSDSLLHSSIFIMGSTVITSGIGYLYWIIAAHMYSAHDIGLASAFISAMTLTSTFANFGIGSALVQVLPKREAGYAWSITLNACISMSILTSLIGGTFAAVALPFFSSQFAIANYQLIYIFIFSMGVMLWTVTILLDQTFIAERATSNVAIRNAVFALLKLPIMVLLFRVGALGIFSSWILALAIVVFLTLLVLIPRLKRNYGLFMRGMKDQIRHMFSLFIGHHFINIGSLLPMYLLPVFVAIRLSAVDNAYFYTTWMMCGVFFMVSPSVATALFSEGSHVVNNVMQKARTSVLIISILLSPILLVFFFGGYQIMSLFGPSYPRHGLSLLMLLMIAAVPDAITNVYVSVLRVQKRLRLASLLNLTMAAITLILAWLLLPILGIAGAGLAWLIGQVFGSLIVGIDVLISRKHVLESMLVEGVLGHHVSVKSDQNYVVAKAIWFIDTVMLPATGFPAISGTSGEENISLMDTAMLPATGFPAINGTSGEENISLMDTAMLPTTRLPAISGTSGEESRITDPYAKSQLFERTINNILIGEDEMA